MALEADFAIPVSAGLGELGVLTEPASVLAKAWEQIERIRSRACAVHERALITGAGPIGLLAALMAMQRGFDTHVLDRAESGIKPELVRALGRGLPHRLDRGGLRGGRAGRDRGVHGRGAARGGRDAIHRSGAIVCLTGVAPSRSLSVDVGAINNEIVLENDVVFGSVNANRRHFEQAAPR